MARGKFLSLRAHDLERTHHAVDVSASVAQRAIQHAEKRDAQKNRPLEMLRRLEKRYAKRVAAALREQGIDRPAGPISDREWLRQQALQDLPTFLCATLAIDLAPPAVAMWLRYLRTLEEKELGFMLDRCLPATIDEWKQRDLERRSGRRVKAAA